MSTIIESRPCRSCPADIYLLKNISTGRWMPVDVEPSSVGNVRIDIYRRTCEVLTGEARRNAAAQGDELHNPHHRTCDHADEHRRQRPTGPPPPSLFDAEEEL